MDWLKKIAGYAPDIAAAIATGGTSVIASTALRIAAQEMTGIPGSSIDDVANAVRNATPEQMAALTIANNNFLVQMRTLDVQQIGMVNQTMQSETKSEHWCQYGWRPFWGFASAIAFIGLVVIIGILAYQAIAKGNQNAMTMIPQIISASTMLFGIPAAILGVASWHRGKEKRIRAGEKSN